LAQAGWVIPIQTLDLMKGSSIFVVVYAVELHRDSHTTLAGGVDGVDFVEPAEEEALLDSFRTCGECQPLEDGKDEENGLVRVGNQDEGGYLMCESALQNSSIAFSVGLTAHNGWGEQVSRDYGIAVHEFDCDTKPLSGLECSADKPCDVRYHSVCVNDDLDADDDADATSDGVLLSHKAPSSNPFENLWNSFKKSSFVKSATNAVNYMRGRSFETLDEMIASTLENEMIASNVPLYDKNLLLRMNVQGGAEWGALFKTDEVFFARFRQLVMEFHDLDKRENYRTYYHCMKKILKRFDVVHTHGDNSAGVAIFSIPREAGNVTIPARMEVTFVRKDLVIPTTCTSGHHLFLDHADVEGNDVGDPVLPDTVQDGIYGALVKKAAKPASLGDLTDTVSMEEMAKRWEARSEVHTTVAPENLRSHLKTLEEMDPLAQIAVDPIGHLSELREASFGPAEIAAHFKTGQMD